MGENQTEKPIIDEYRFDPKYVAEIESKKWCMCWEKPEFWLCAFCGKTGLSRTEISEFVDFFKSYVQAYSLEFGKSLSNFEIIDSFKNAQTLTKEYFLWVWGGCPTYTNRNGCLKFGTWIRYLYEHKIDLEPIEEIVESKDTMNQKKLLGFRITDLAGISETG